MEDSTVRPRLKLGWLALRELARGKEVVLLLTVSDCELDSCGCRVDVGEVGGVRAVLIVVNPFKEWLERRLHRVPSSARSTPPWNGTSAGCVCVGALGR